MRLHRHDELVEAMARARATIDGFEWSALSSPLQCDYIRNAAAALDALLEAAVRLKISRDATAYAFAGDEVWGAGPPELVVEDCFPALILRMEASDDK